MKIGPQTHRSSAISASNPETIVVRGRRLSEELIGQVGFTDYFWLLLTGQMPSSAQRRVLDATLWRSPSTAWCPAWWRPG